MCLGNLITNVMGLPQLLGTDSSWPYLLGIMFIPAVVHIVGLPFCVDSPKYLYITRNKPDKAKDVLKKLRGLDADSLVKRELEELSVEKEKLNNQKTVAYMDLIRKASLRRPLIISITLQAAQQFSGIIVVIFYSTIIFKSIGLDEDTWAVYAAILIALVETIVHVFTMFLIDLKGRRFLLMSGMIGMGLSCFCLALTRLFSDKAEFLKYVAIVAVVVYIIFYSIGLGKYNHNKIIIIV